jgi:hypothetical protein
MTGALQTESSGLSVPPSFDTRAMDFVRVEREEYGEPILAVCELNAETRAKLSAVQRRDPDQAAHNPRAAPSMRGLTFDSIARQHLVEPRMATRGALLAKPIITKADAIAGIDLIACLESDAELVLATALGLRQYLAVD